MRFANVVGSRGESRVVSVQKDGSYLDIVGALGAVDALRGRDSGRVVSTPLQAAVNEDLQRRLPSAIEALQRSGRYENFVLPADSKLLAPVPDATRILAIGRNYAEHAKEQGNSVFEEPIVFLKASTSIIGPDEPIVIPSWVGRVDYETELLVVLGRGGQNINEAEAMGCVAGYSVFNDVTARDQQRAAIERKHPWFLSKSLDSFGPMGPYLVTADEISDPHNLQISLRVNGQVKQHDTTASMVYKIPTLIAFLSKWFALHPGDVIATGTPSGIGALAPGDVVEATVEGIGTLRNPVIAVP